MMCRMLGFCLNLSLRCVLILVSVLCDVLISGCSCVYCVVNVLGLCSVLSCLMKWCMLLLKFGL